MIFKENNKKKEVKLCMLYIYLRKCSNTLLWGSGENDEGILAPGFVDFGKETKESVYFFLVKF